ncbi:glycoside hydrolase family 13 protein [Nocardia arthritidis]|uniref:DUF3459 domain-containing protein n=1 Tax=Nocardia arthritidis TaxID=228602 RepID=A0A6G9YPE2_9NOCA|nr:glycoside hydrolase family 13 protein [Nocardia arthritidis]QIS15165.1 DUF3459 domain-containing protein [Nocardia arthritidis]
MIENSGPGLRWWRHATIYQIYVRSFADGDGDGIGDLSGIRTRLPYLAALGVDAVWLTPFYVSPMADGGYDVADHRAVDPLFGGLDDLSALIADAHLLGLRVLIDLVPNHTSAQHIWFVEALAAGPGSLARERYVFRDGRGELPPNDWESCFGGPAWTRVPDGQWYLHLFDSGQPDLNWDNADVLTEFDEILRFWLDRGVDGFRIDVAHAMVKAAGLPDVGHGGQWRLMGVAELPYLDQDGVHEIHRRWRKILDSYPGERIATAELFAPNAARSANYLRPDELHQAFNFHYLHTEWDAAEFRSVIDASIDAVSGAGATSTWVLSNHDVVRHVTRYGGGELGTRRARAAALLTLALPGSAYLYQGEELGLAEVTDLPEEVLADPIWERSGRTERGRDGCRVPIPWSGAEPPFGFGPQGAAPWLPQPDHWVACTAEAQSGTPGSMLELYRSALALRRELLSHSDFTWRPGPDGVLAFDRGPSFRCTVNFTDEPVTVPVPGELLLSSAEELEIHGGTAELAANSAAWWAVG